LDVLAITEMKGWYKMGPKWEQALTAIATITIKELAMPITKYTGPDRSEQIKMLKQGLSVPSGPSGVSSVGSGAPYIKPDPSGWVPQQQFQPQQHSQLQQHITINDDPRTVLPPPSDPFATPLVLSSTSSSSFLPLGTSTPPPSIPQRHSNTTLTTSTATPTTNEKLSVIPLTAETTAPWKETAVTVKSRSDSTGQVVVSFLLLFIILFLLIN